MKFTVNRNQLLQAMLHTRINVSHSCVMLWANHYMMNIQDKVLSITGTDGDMFIREDITLEEELSGSVSTNATFYVHNGIIRAIKTLEEQPLEFTIEEYQLTVNHSCGHFRVPLSNIAFPDRKPSQAEDEICLRMEAPGLYSQLSKVSFAVADDLLRPVMNGVFMEVERDYLNFTASDGHILMSLKKICQEPNVNTCKFIIPGYVVNTILKILPKTGYCVLCYGDNIARLKIEDSIQVDFKCIDGRYPNYKAVIPTQSFNSVFSVEKKPLLKALNRLLLFCGSSTKGVKFALDNPGFNLISLNAKDFDEDVMGQEKLTCEFTHGADNFSCGIMFKIPLLKRIINNITADKVTFQCTGSNTSCLLAFEPTSDIEQLTALIMPMMQTDDD